MSRPDMARLLHVLESTWPAAETRRLGPFLLRRGDGGGNRVSAASTDRADVAPEQIARAEAAMRAWNQPPRFRLTPENAALDRRLAGLGYAAHDRSLLIAGPVEAAARSESVPHDGIPCDRPLALMRAFWAENGIGPARLRVMARVALPKTHLIARHGDRVGAAAFVAVDGDIAMLHALVVAPDSRRAGLGRRMMARAAIWAEERGARVLAVATTGENLPAQRLFAGLGMTVVGHYHYRTKQPGAEMP